MTTLGYMNTRGGMGNNSVPFANVMRTIAPQHQSPMMPHMRQNHERRSVGNAIVLPKLNTPGRNRSMASHSDMLSPPMNGRNRGGS